MIRRTNSPSLVQMHSVQMHNHPKHTAKSQEFLKAKKWQTFQWPSQSVSHLYPTEHAFQLLKKKPLLFNHQRGWWTHNTSAISMTGTQLQFVVETNFKWF